MRKRFWVLAAGCALASCGSTSDDVRKAEGALATRLGVLVDEIEFSKIHVDDGHVCGYANGQKFDAFFLREKWHASLVDDAKMPDYVKKLVEDSFIACMNEAEPFGV